MGSRETEVIVAGGGPVGLSMAIALRRFGVDCVLVEKHPSTLDFPRGRAVSVRTMEIMRRWGLEDALVGAGLARAESLAIFRGATLLAPDFDRVVIDPPAAGTVSPTQALICDQEDMEAVLRDAAAASGADLRFGTELVSHDDRGDDGGVRCTVVDRPTGRRAHIEGRWLVAADGAHSSVRDRLGITRTGPGVLGSRVSILFEADLAERVSDRASGLYRLDALPGAVIAAVDNEIAWLLIYAFDPDLEPRDSFSPQRLRELVRLALGDPGVPFTVEDHRFWEPTALVCDRFRSGRVFLAGDAAHVVTPVGGLGMNCGISDVENLSWKLAAVTQGWAGPDLLDSYEVERRPVAQATAEASLGRAAPPAPVDGLVLGTSYQSSAVIGDGTLRTEPEDPVGDYLPSARPGSRAPHLWLDPRRERSTLDLFGDGFTLLTDPAGSGWRDEAARIPRVEALAIDHPDWPALYGVDPSGAVLVRPDGFVAWRSSGAPSTPGQLAVVMDRAVGRRG